MAKNKGLVTFGLVLGLIGVLNWGLVGLFKFNLVEMLFGTAAFWIRATYTVVAVGGIYGILTKLSE